MGKKDWVEEIGNIELEISYTSGVYDLAFLMGYGWYEEVEKIVEQIKQESREEGYADGVEHRKRRAKKYFMDGKVGDDLDLLDHADSTYKLTNK